jgi:hypothetical protein
MPESTRVTIKTFLNLPEAIIARTHLEAAGIDAYLHGEHAASTDPRMGLAGGIRLQVWAADQRRALAVLDEAPSMLSSTPGDPVPEGAVCPVHEVPATLTCARCGTFGCTRCRMFGEPALCEDCVASEAHPSGGSSRRSWVRVVAAIMLAPGLLMILIVALINILRLFIHR